MKTVRSWVLAGVLCALILASPVSLAAREPEPANQQDIVALLNKQNSTMANELRRIQREIAALRADLSKPGLKDVFSGIGYIFGLFGVAAFVASRRKE